MSREGIFEGRPARVKIGAWASAQSEVISGRDELEKRQAELEETYRDQLSSLATSTGAVIA